MTNSQTITVHALVSVQVVHPYSSIDTTASWKKLCFILLDRSNFHMTDRQTITVYALVSVQVVHPYSSMDTTASWKRWCFILLDRSDFHMTDSQTITAHAFASRILMSFLVGVILLPRILLAYGLPRETIAAIIMLYKNTKVKVCTQDGDTDFFNIVAGVL